MQQCLDMPKELIHCPGTVRVEALAIKLHIAPARTSYVMNTSDCVLLL